MPAKPHTIPVTLDPANDSVIMPVDYHVSVGDYVRWAVPDGAKLLVSFRDGTSFDILDSLAPVNIVRRSPDVRDGEYIRVSQPGRFSYRFAMFANGKIYGVFDCPSIIIW